LVPVSVVENDPGDYADAVPGKPRMPGNSLMKLKKRYEPGALERTPAGCGL